MKPIGNPPDFDPQVIGKTNNDNEMMILLWKAYFSRQKIIKLLRRKEDIQKVEPNYEDIVFAILFPKSMAHFYDFSHNFPSGIATALFKEDGSVILLDLGEQMIKESYGEACKEIHLRTYGRKLDFIDYFNPPSDEKTKKERKRKNEDEGDEEE